MKRPTGTSTQGSDNAGRPSSGKWFTDEGREIVRMVDIGDEKTTNSANKSTYFWCTFRANDGREKKKKLYTTERAMKYIDKLITACGYDPATISPGVEFDHKLLEGSVLVIEIRRVKRNVFDKEKGEYIWKEVLDVVGYHRFDEDAPLKPWPTGGAAPAQASPVVPETPSDGGDTKDEDEDEIPF